jgi:hypothetical protein
MDILRAIKSAAHIPLGWEVKREGTMSKDVKELLKSHRDELAKFSFPRPSPTSPDVSGIKVRS